MSDKGSEEMLEIRLFGLLKKYGEQKGWSFPYNYPLKRECTGLELVEVLGIPFKEIEGIFVNGIAFSLQEARIKPGSRIGFIPYGMPGPYRIMLGLKKGTN